MEMETYAFDGDNAEVPTALVRAGAGNFLPLPSRLRVIEMHLIAEHALNTVVHGACTIHSFPGELE
jgi:hypothetical protein